MIHCDKANICFVIIFIFNIFKFPVKNLHEQVHKVNWYLFLFVNVSFSYWMEIWYYNIHMCTFYVLIQYCHANEKKITEIIFLVS